MQVLRVLPKAGGEEGDGRSGQTKMKGAAGAESEGRDGGGGQNYLRGSEAEVAMGAPRGQWGSEGGT